MRKGILVLAFLLLVAGVGVLVYPYVQQELYRRYARNLITDFQDRLDEYREEMIRSGFGDFPGTGNGPAGNSNSESGNSGESNSENNSGSNSGNSADYSGNSSGGNPSSNSGNSVPDPFHWLYQQMSDYNNTLYETGQSNIVDPFSFEDVDFSLQEFGFRDEMIGFITIPQMDVELPIFLGASHENLDRGAGLIMQTSLPMGGMNTNAVIAAHRGLGTAVMFRDIERLEIGDEFFVTNFYQTLRYAVVGTQIIYPTDIDAILIQSGRDMVTLFTCHPYRLNHQRFLVFAERVE